MDNSTDEMLISEEEYRIHRTIIYSVVLFFEVFGLFGNVNLVVLTIRKKSLQTKYGLILAFLAALHTLCLLYELVDMSFSIAATFYSYLITKSTCFLALFPYIFIHSLQTGTLWVLSLDLLLTIVFPIRYRTFQPLIYFLSLFILPVVYGTVIVALGFVHFPENTLIKMCNPPSALDIFVNSVWYNLMMIFNLLTVVFYLSAFLLIHIKARRNSQDNRFIERKALKTLKLLIVMSLILRCVPISVTSLLIDTMNMPEEIVELVESYSIVLGIVAYSQNAYICYFRSSEYRVLLREQLTMVFPGLEAVLPMNEKPSSFDWRRTSVSVVTTNRRESRERLMNQRMSVVVL